MRALSIAGILFSFVLPSTALAGPEGTFHVKGANPDDGGDYSGTVKIVRKGEVYSVVWKFDGNETVGIGVGLRLVDGQLVAGPADEGDTGISVSYAADDTPGTATYIEQSDGTWHGVWAYQGDEKLSTEEWIPTVRQVGAKTATATASKARTTAAEAVDVNQETSADSSSRMEISPLQVRSSPLPASASPKS